MQTNTAANIILAARQQADCETPTPTVDFVTDTEALRYLTSAYRKLVDLIIEAGGQDLIAVSATPTAPSYTLPADYYRAISLDIYLNGAYSPLTRFNWRERFKYVNTEFPAWRIINNALVFYPTDATPTVTLWYVQDVTALSSTSATLNVYNGWDDYLIADIAAAMLEKEERDPSVQWRRRDEAQTRIERAARDQAPGSSDTVALVERTVEDYFDYWR